MDRLQVALIKLGMILLAVTLTLAVLTVLKA